jgi:hypothetical protein
MKKLFYQLSSSRSFTKLFSILPLAVLAFAALELFFVQQALAAGNLCCKIGTTGCPNTTGATGVVLAGNHYCEGSTACNSTSYRFERTATLAKKACYSSVTPPSDSTSFTLSGPPTVCQFFRPDLKDVQVAVDSLAFADPSADTGPHEVTLSGVAVCGLRDEVDRNFAYFDVNNVKFGCVTRTALNSNTITYTEFLGDCPEGDLVSGNFTGRADLPVSGDIDRMLTYCPGGVPEVTPGPLAGCMLNVGVEVGVIENFFERRVCPKDPPLEAGQIFAFKETIVNEQFRPGSVDACYCHSDLDGGDVTCGQGNTAEPINTNTAGATECEFDWAKTGTPSGDTLNLTGKNQVNGAIYDSPECPVAEIATNTLRVCNDVTPRQIKIGTFLGRHALTFQISEPNCIKSLQVSVPLVAGDTRLIYATGAFKDTTRFVGSDDVLVVK